MNVTTPPIDYYQDDSKWGEYQYVLLSEMVNNFLTNAIGDDKLLVNTKRYNVLYHMKRGIQELNYDTAKDTLTVELEIGDNLSITLPPDYVNYAHVYSVDSEGDLHELREKSNSKRSREYLQDDKFNILFDQDGFPLEATPSTSEGNYKKAKTCEETFIVDRRAGIMSFSSAVLYKTIMLEYVSDGLQMDADRISIHKFLEQCLYDYTKYMLLNNKYGVQEYIIKRVKDDYHASLKNAKIRMLDLKRVNLMAVILNRP